MGLACEGHRECSSRIHSDNGRGGELPGCRPKKTNLLASLAAQPQVADPRIEGSRGYANLCK